MKPPEHIETKWLFLRPIRLEDSAMLFSHGFSRPEVVHYLEWRPHGSLEQTKELIRDWVDAWQSDRAYIYTIINKADGAVAGCSSLEPSKGCRMELGGFITKSFWGRGYGREAWKALIEAAFTLDDIYSVWAVCDVDNQRSKKALESIGMKCEAVLKRYVIRPNIGPLPRDVFYFSILK